MCVEGDEVEIDRICCLSADFAPGFPSLGTAGCAGVCFTVGVVEGFT